MKYNWKGLVTYGTDINCKLCESGKYCDAAKGHGYHVGSCVMYNPEQRKKQTNADIIRHLSNEELTDFFVDMCACLHENADACEKVGHNCYKCWLDWLNLEGGVNDDS